MMVVAALVFMGTSVTTKAASLLKVSDVSISKSNVNNLVLKHANQLFSENAMSTMAEHGSHSSHSSHVSHSSHYSAK